MCRWESLESGAIDLADIARMNDELDILEDNQRLAEEAHKPHG